MNKEEFHGLSSGIQLVCGQLRHGGGIRQAHMIVAILRENPDARIRLLALKPEDCRTITKDNIQEYIAICNQ